MIQFADSLTRSDVRSMWKTCFGDSNAYIDLYFSRKYKDENTLVYLQDGIVVASLQMLDYKLTFCGVEIPFSYISGACTLPQYRKKGYMDKLLVEAFEVMRQRSIPLSILIPGEEWLYGFYQKYGYEKCFQGDDKPIELKRILDKNSGDIKATYQEFKQNYLNQDFCVQKSKQDFEAMLAEAELFNYPIKTNLSGMVRIINASVLLELFAKKNPEKSLTLKVDDDLLKINQSTFTILNGTCLNTDKEADMEVDIRSLSKLLFGFKLEELPAFYSGFFETHHPTMSLMLE